MAEENALLSFQHECGVCAHYSYFEGGENATMEETRRRNKWKNDDYDSLESKYMADDASSKKFIVNFKHTLQQKKKELTLVKFGSHLRIEESLKVQDSDKPKSNNFSCQYGEA
ncbi:hypothetical protein Tco_0981931 [Tanacetum coccineum]